MTHHSGSSGSPWVHAFTDGACSGNPGPGGWGVLLRWGNVEKELYGGAHDTTNNRMELTAVIEALTAMKRSVRVIVFTDSKYVQQGISKWILGWKRNGWRTASKEPVKNIDLWTALDAATALHEIDWRWVKGHDGHEGNERADALARRGIKTLHARRR